LKDFDQTQRWFCAICLREVFIYSHYYNNVYNNVHDAENGTERVFFS